MSRDVVVVSFKFFFYKIPLLSPSLILASIYKLMIPILVTKLESGRLDFTKTKISLRDNFNYI